MLRVDLLAYDSQSAYSTYNSFSLASEGLGYKLHINEYDHASPAGRQFVVNCRRTNAHTYDRMQAFNMYS